MKHDGDDRAEQPVWSPSGLNPDVPPYLALLQALEDDVRNGALPAGARLPPHRSLAARLGISISTVSKAYREAGARGLISGRTGHGTFVHAQDARQPAGRAEAGPINLGFNQAPFGRQREAIRAVLADLVRSPGLDDLFALRSHQGFPEHRAELAQWLKAPGFEPSPDRIVITNGAQHGIDLAIQILCRPGEKVLVEELTYIGFKALSLSRQFPMIPVAMDEEGLVPEALEAAILREKARVLYATPTLHSPTARSMPIGRRRAIADILERHDIAFIEDDVFGFLPEERLAPIAGLIPNRTVHLVSFSKILELGFRVGVMIVPVHLVERANLAMRATAWIAAPILVEVLAQLIKSGMLDELVSEARKESAARSAMFHAIFGLPSGPAPSGYHVWLPLPAGWTQQDLFYAARNHGVLLTPPGSAAVGPARETGLRVCLGPSANRAELRTALLILKQVLDEPAQPFLSVT